MQEKIIKITINLAVESIAEAGKGDRIGQGNLPRTSDYFTSKMSTKYRSILVDKNCIYISIIN